MKNYSFLKSALGVFMLIITLTSCVKTTTTFKFTYVCSDELLQFVTPTVNWKNSQGTEVSFVLTDQFFKDKSDFITISSGSVAKRYYDHKIMVNGEGMSRDLTISYALKDNAPDVNAKEYAFYHKIFGSQNVEKSSWFSTTISQEIKVSIGSQDIYTQYLSGEALTKALEELVNKPDYYLLESGKQDNSGTSQKQGISFDFQLKCSEELLDFVIPCAVFIDSLGTEHTVDIPKSQFTKVDDSGLVGNNTPVIYTWEKQIFLPNVVSGQRDMRVEYKWLENTPVIDLEKTYAMVHRLTAGYSKYTTNGFTSYHSDVTIIVNGENSDYIQGSKLQNYLDDLIGTPDYVKREVN